MSESLSIGAIRVQVNVLLAEPANGCEVRAAETIEELLEVVQAALAYKAAEEAWNMASGVEEADAAQAVLFDALERYQPTAKGAER